MFRNLLREALLFIGCAVFVGTVGLVLLDTVMMPYVVRKGEQAVVPDVAGMTPQRARQMLARSGLRLKLGEPRWDASIPEGQIVFQSPAAYSRVKGDRTIHAFLSRGTRRYRVPDVHGRPLRQARLWLEQSSLSVGEVVQEASAEVAEGLVVRQEPQAGEDVVAGTPVLLAVSDGPPGEQVVVPNVVGLKLEAARSELALRDLGVKDVRYEFSTSYVPNTVIQQVPGAGEEARQGTGVRLVVSKL